MTVLPNHTALKEWASVISALESGEQTMLLRKGGIAEPSFSIESERFYLFPTYLHQREKQFKPEALQHFDRTDREAEPATLSISSWAEIVKSWPVPDLDTLRKLEPFFIFTSDTLEERFRFRPEQRLQLFALRVWRLEKPVTVTNLPEYAGCRSWLSLEAEIDVTGSRPVLSELELQERFDSVERLR